MSQSTSSQAGRRLPLGETTFLAIAFACLVIGIVFTRDLTANGQLVPEILALIGIPLVALRVAQLLRRKDKGGTVAEQDVAESASSTRELLVAGGWVVGFFLMSLLAGMLVAIPVFIAAYLRQGGTGWRGSITTSAVTTALTFAAFERALDIELYRGIFWP